ncbi:hypothetical protein [Candidatus Poriferisodalis sp.]|uniref:hypothetical protein n=1 Tax=Candidatus Poriferisodalis sp. TaxID=3101277 RepID=UPI003B027E0E
MRRMRFVGIYDADGSLAGELGYAFAKLTGRRRCALCDITHGWNPLGSRAWKQACADSPVQLELVHRDKATASQLAAATALPAIVADDGEDWSEAMSRADIEACAGSVEQFLERLRTL